MESQTETGFLNECPINCGRYKLCTEHQINQAQYYQWRDQFLANAGQAFEVHQQSQRETRLHQENARLKQVVGELTLELKKNDDVWG